MDCLSEIRNFLMLIMKIIFFVSLPNIEMYWLQKIGILRKMGSFCNMKAHKKVQWMIMDPTHGASIGFFHIYHLLVSVLGFLLFCVALHHQMFLTSYSVHVLHQIKLLFTRLGPVFSNDSKAIWTIVYFTFWVNNCLMGNSSKIW